MRALADTSFFVAVERDGPRRELADVDQIEVSVMSLAELTIGVLLAGPVERAERLATLSAVESSWDALPVDAKVAREFASIVAKLRAERRRVPVVDALIAATAVVEGVPLLTQDRDYDLIEGLEVIRV